MVEFADIVAGGGVFHLNILFTIIIVRLILDPVIEFSLRGRTQTIGMAIFLLALVPISYEVTEYGTQALMVAIFGYAIRHRQSINNDNFMNLYMGLSIVALIIIQYILFDFSQSQFFFLILTSLLIHLGLAFFRFQTYPDLTKKISHIAVCLIQLGGRRTLEIYVAHLLLFKIGAIALGSPDYVLFDFRLFNTE